MPERFSTIRALARAAGETTETVRFCEREGLLRRSDDGGYDDATLATLRLIRLGQRLRIPLDDIRAAARANDAATDLDGVMRRWVLRRLTQIAREQDELGGAQATLLSFLSRSQLTGEAEPERAREDLAKLHRDLGGAPEARRDAPRGGPPRRRSRESLKLKPAADAAVGVRFVI